LQLDPNKFFDEVLIGNRAIVLFDGYCNFCNSSINFLLRIDKRKVFLFAASQSNAGRMLAEKFNLKSIDSVVLIANGNVYFFSSAIIKIVSQLNYPWKALGIIKIAPTFLRDAIYKWIAINRYKWFGKRAVCRIPTTAEREQFLN
jgi:predicted DCC family thiol-disulfide oxidoreductase YuxK